MEDFAGNGTYSKLVEAECEADRSDERYSPEEMSEFVKDAIRGSISEKVQRKRKEGAELYGALAGFEPTQEELDADPRLARIWLKYMSIDSDSGECE